MSFFNELKRRNVFKVAIAYVVVAWLIAQVLQLVFESFGTPDWVMKTVLVLMAAGLLFALFFSWAFEMTPEGLKREHEVDRSQSITPQTGKKLNGLIVALMALAIAYFAYDKFVLSAARESAAIDSAVDEATAQINEQRVATESRPEQQDTSIAVLAFEDMSQAGDQEYLSDGIAEELLNLLAKIPDLRVTSRSSAFSYKGKDIKLDQIAEELNVAHILEGSIRKAGNKVRITAQLIETRTDTHLWSETYDRELDDIFAIQDEISAAVVEQLKVTLLGEAPHVEETDPEAYALYLQARHLYRLGTVEGWEQSNSLYEQALEIEPDYPAAWNGMATNYMNLAGSGQLGYEEGYALAREATEKALAIDPNFATAHDGLGWIAMMYDNSLAASARHYERALQLEPSNPHIIAHAAVLLHMLGRQDEALAIIELNTVRDPVNAISHYNLAVLYGHAGRWDDAITSAKTGLRLSPGKVGAHYHIGQALLFKGQFETALESFNKEEGDEELRVKGQALALYAMGRQEEHQAKLDELIERWGDEWPSEVAHVYAYIGDKDSAFDWLQKTAEASLGWQIAPGDLFWRPLTGDPRWLPLLESIGQSPEQLAAIEFEMTLPE